MRPAFGEAVGMDTVAKGLPAPSNWIDAKRAAGCERIMRANEQKGQLPGPALCVLL